MPHRWLLWLPLLLLAVPTCLLAGEYSCPGPDRVMVGSDDPATRSEMCLAAKQALAFLAQYDLRPKQTIRIDIVDQKINNHGYPSFGRYEGDVDRVQIMSYRSIMAMAEPPKMYGEPFDRVHYHGVIAHEVAHAVVEHNLRRKKFAVVSSEYLAHATQLAVMPAERRQRVIAAIKVLPWRGGDTISPIYMAMSPEKFAVKSYLHLASLPHPGRFVRLLLESRWFDVYVPKDLG